jgi:hypothetical protein
MPHLFQNQDTITIETIIGKDLVKTGECVALVQAYSNVGHTSTWVEGAKITTTSYPSKGTAIATFVNGKYPNASTGNHAAFFYAMTENGMEVVDQYKSLKAVQKRTIRFTGKGGSNDAGAFSVIK